MYDQYQAEKVQPSADRLAQLSSLASVAVTQQREIDDLEEKLKQAKQRLAGVVEKDIPTLMDEIEMAEYVLSSGERITVHDELRTSISAANNDAAMDWLDEAGDGGMIKRTLTISFNRDETAWANKFEADLRRRKKPVRVERKLKVEPPTLKAYIKGALEQGRELPTDLFNIFIQRKAKIDTKKAKKAAADF